MSLSLLILLFFVNLAHSQDVCDQKETLLKVKDIILKNYLWKDKLQDFNPNSLEDAINFLRRIGDRWSTITKEEDEKRWFNQSKLLGVGIRWDDDGVITKVFQGSPADKAGLKKGDKILSILGVRDAKQWASAIGKAKEGDSIDILLLRDDKIYTFLVQKGEFHIPPIDAVEVFTLNGKRYGYVSINNFTNPTAEAFKKALKYFAEHSVDEVIIDLRYNGGGLISVVKDMIDTLITGEGIAFYLEEGSGKVRFYNFLGEGDPYDVNITILIGKATASASELFSSVLRYYKGARIIGELSTGKYVGSTIYKLNECGDVMRLVTFEMKLPDGYPITSQMGIVPDCYIKNSTKYTVEEVLRKCSFRDLEHVANGL